jgi:small conductance mechanosensitive channel
MATNTVLPLPLQPYMSREAVELAKLSDMLGDFAANLVIAALILAATLWFSRWGARLARAGVARYPRTREDVTLQDFASSVVRYGVWIFGLIAVLRRLGVETTSIITVLGAASLAIGLALQGALGNVAAGVMIVVFRPFRVGDFVTIAGKSGVVKRFDLFNTEIWDPDNLKITVPNGKAFGDVIVNATDIACRRIELTFSIHYDDDVSRAIEILKACATEDPRILKDPAPWAKATDLQPSWVVVTLRAWANLDVYWDARFDLLLRAKQALAAAGHSVPYPAQVAVERPAKA